MILSISDVAELKRTIAEQFSLQIHFHDACGGQHFTVDEPTGALVNFLTEYFAERNLKVIFSEDCTHFSVEKLSLC